MRLPTFVDLRPAVDMVEDQGQAGTCVAHGAHKAIEIAYERIGKRVNLSPMYLYYWSKILEGNWHGGTHLRFAMQVLQERGICTEASWPYELSNISNEPPERCNQEAAQYRTLGWEGYSSLPTACDDIRKFLAQGKPVVLVMMAPSSLVEAGNIKNWKQTKWDITQPGGLHCVTAIGYDDVSKRILVQNSWGPDWADGGFFGLPYEYCGKVLLDARALKLSIPYISAGYMDDRAVWDTLIDWAEKKYDLGKDTTKEFGPYLYRKYGDIYFGLDKTRQEIVQYTEADGFKDRGNVDYWWGQM